MLTLAPPQRLALAQKRARQIPTSSLTSQKLSKRNAPTSSAPSPAPASFSSGNVVIYRVGSGTGSLANTGNPVFLDEYTPGGALVQSIPLPTTASGSNKQLIASGTSSSEGLLTRSTDGQFLILTGYASDLGGATNLTGTSSATVPRTVGRVSSTGSVDTTTALTDFSTGSSPRSAVSDNGTNLWVAGGAGGPRFTTLGTTTSSQLSTTTTNLRQINIFGDFDGTLPKQQLYVSSQSGTTRVAEVGDGVPTTSGQTIANIPGIPTTIGGSNTSPYSFFFADLDAGVAGVDTLYVADDNSPATGGGIQKYSLVSGTWVAKGTITATSPRGLTGVVSGSNVILYATTGGTAATGGGSLYSFTDTTGYNATVSGSVSTIATAGTNTAFRGVALAPIAAGDAAPTVSSTTPAGGATNVSASANVTVTFSEAVNAPDAAFTLSCTSSGSHTFARSTADNITFTLNPDTDFTAGEQCTLTVVAAQVTDQDSADPPDNMAANFTATFTVASATPTLNIGDVTQAEGDAGQTAFNFTVSLTSPAGASGVTFNASTADGTTNPANAGSDYVALTNQPFTITSGNSSTIVTVQVNGDTTTEPNETFFVNITSVTGATPGDVQGLGTITNDDVTLTPIHNIQGSGTASPLATQSVTTRGIVTGIKSGTSGGFFIQEPDATADADPNTSEGVFVFTGASLPAAAVVGNAVQVTGTVQEFVFSSDPHSPPVTEISGSPTVSTISTGNPLPAPITLTPAETTAPSETTNPLDSLEEYEGMRVTVPSMTVVAPTDGTINEPNATVSGNDVFYGVVTGVARPMREPGVNISDPLPPGSPANVPRFDENPERIRVDSDGQPGTTTVDVAAGTVLTNVTGPLDYSFRTYTILPDTTIVPGAQPGAVPVPVPTANELTVASFNMERFFDTLSNGGSGAPVLTQTAFDKRLDKASRIIRTVQHYPDVIGVEEMENLSTLQAVAAKINADAQNVDGLPNPNYVAYLVEGNDVGGIDVGFLVKESRVTTVSVTQFNKTETFTNPNTGAQETLNDRPPLVLRATAPRPGGGTFAFTVIVNHLRSLSGVDDDVTVNGTGTEGSRIRAKRKAQAESLANLIQSFQTADPTEKIITVGDMNAFQFNDGFVDVIGTVKGTPSPDDQTVVPGDGADLVNPDLTDLVDTLPASQRYSFTFDGNAQVLDHIIVNDDALAVVNRFAYARDDADFPVKNYELANELRLSDHDQPIVYLSLGAPQPAGSLIISEFRLQGPGGANDEFIEIYNNTDSAQIVATTDGSAGYAVVSSSNTALNDGVPTVRCTIPTGTVIPARGHYLCTNSVGYSLASYPAGNGTTATGDATYATDIPFNDGLAIFNTATPANFSTTTRLDAVGSSTETNTLYKEGTGYTALAGGASASIEHSLLRDLCGKQGSVTQLGACPTLGFPRDTNNNAVDFFLVDTNGTPTGGQQRLGAPGPENLSSPIQRNSTMPGFLLDATKASSAPPNRVRDFTSDPANNSTFGTLDIRRRIVNNTGSPVTRLRFRVIDITTFPSVSTPGFADLRPRTSTSVIVSNVADAGTCGALQTPASSSPTPPCNVTVQGTTLEQPPSQPNGGGFNSSLSAETVSQASPLAPGQANTVVLATPLAPGESINVRFLLGVQATGTFKFFVNIEAVTAPVPVGAAPKWDTLKRKN